MQAEDLDECAVVRLDGWVISSGVVGRRPGWERAGLTLSEITSYFMLHKSAFLDVESFYLHLNTWLLAHISCHRSARIRIFFLCETVDSLLVEAGGVFMAMAIAFSTNGSLTTFMVDSSSSQLSLKRPKGCGCIRRVLGV